MPLVALKSEDIVVVCLTAAIPGMKNGKEACSLRGARRNMELLNNPMRYRHEVAVSVVSDAKRVWNEIWDACLDPITPEQIIRGMKANNWASDLPAGGWSELREKLHLLGHYLDYSFRLLKADGADRDDDQGGPDTNARFNK